MTSAQKYLKETCFQLDIDRKAVENGPRYFLPDQMNVTCGFSTIFITSCFSNFSDFRISGFFLRAQITKYKGVYL